MFGIFVNEYLVKEKYIIRAHFNSNSKQSGVRDVTSANIFHGQTQSNRVCCFQTFDAVFPKDLFSDYLNENGSESVF